MRKKSKPNIERLIDASFDYQKLIVGLLLVFILLRLFDAFVLSGSFGYSHAVIVNNLIAIPRDIYVALKVGGFLIVPFFGLTLLRRNIARYFFLVAGMLVIVASYSLQLYFATSKVLLGSDLFSYDSEELTEILHSSRSVSFLNIGIGILFPLLLIGIWLLIRKLKFPRWSYYITYPSMAIVMLTSGLSIANGGSEEAFVQTNKLGYFSSQVIDYLNNKEDVFKIQKVDSLSLAASPISQHRYLSKEYPLLRVDDTKNVLGPFFDSIKVKPNIILVLVESLGRSYSGSGANFGSYTPFLDSLADHSLYFENFLSTAGRTFGVIPSSTGSLPFGERGFASYGSSMPLHSSLISNLRRNGYAAQFVYGGDARFDNMEDYFIRQGIDRIFDAHDSWGSAVKLPANDQGFSWGYGDRDILHKAMELNSKSTKPTITVALTLAMHDPFRVPNQASYDKRFLQRLKESKVPADTKEYLLGYKQQLATVLYFDDSFRQFFNELKKMPSFQNTIILVTGDHRMPEIPIADQLDRFRVPLIIYSPLLKRVGRFSSVSSHFDITPSLTALLRSNSEFQFPKLVSWIGDGLDTVRQYRNIHSIPLMENKNNQTCYLKGEYFVAMGKCYKVTPRLGLADLNDESKLQELTASLNNFKKVNIYVCSNNKLLPDSLGTSNVVVKRK